MGILHLPFSLQVQGTDYAINADFRPCISIMQVFERPDLTDYEKIMCMVGILYVEDVPAEHLEEAARQATWFLNGGDEPREKKTSKNYGRLFSWDQDLRLILAGVDKVNGGSVRSCDFMHWWDFMSCFMEIGECVFSTVVHQRKLKKTGKQTKIDKEWWADNKDIAELDVEKQLTPAEQSAVAEFYRLLEGGAVDGK